GMSFDKPIRHMREYLSILMPMINQGEANFDGETLTGHGAITMPQDTTPCPVLVAALGPQMLRLAGTHTSGSVLWMVGEKTIKDHIAPRLCEAAAKAVCVPDDTASTHSRASKAFAMYGQLPSYRAMLDREGSAGPADVSIIGSEAQVKDRLSAIAEAGATEFSAVEFCKNDDERNRTREVLRSFI
ncbi:MAG: LLM class flavin-dependent oxidoreductase, partial [bacterium]